ncbi:MAG: glycosyltransferase, partial [Acidimicrobiales bacterium]
MSGRTRVAGKYFELDGRRFQPRGVTYGTFAARADGELFPEREQVKADFAAMRAAGFTVVRTYTTPPDDVIDLAADWELRLLSDVYYPDWRYLVGCSQREQRRVARAARHEVRTAARRLAGNEQLFALSLGTEIPADVVRWLGTKRVAAAIRELAEVVRDEDPGHLVTYANYPTAEYLPLETLDFLTFNVFLEQPDDLRRYLTRLHHLAGDRPLVLGELGAHAGSGPAGERAQAASIDWQLETAVERGVAGACVFSWTDDWVVGGRRVDGWSFGLTRTDRSPRPALDVVERWNHRTVRDLDFEWPSMSVVVCAYNAASTIDECLAHVCALDYPDLEIVVVDDGSTDATADLARRHPRARLVPIPHGGLSVARNEGFRQAYGEVVAYLDSDAYPAPEWPYYVALGFDGPEVGGVGGPNLPPPDDPAGAQVVARAPGGPVHVLLSDDRAEHIPGCNMAFWRLVLDETGGFDPIYTAAGDDVDLCWRVLDRGWEIGFHPAAQVWHHRRPGLRPYLRQQRGYGRAEALVEARHPERFTAVGSARWRGRIYTSFAPRLTRQRVYRGTFGAAAFQSVYGGGGHVLDLAHQVGVPASAAMLTVAPLALFLAPWWGVPAAAGVLLLALLAAVDTIRAEPPRQLRTGRWRFRLHVALHHVAQPLVRTWGRSCARPMARRERPMRQRLPAPVRRAAGGVLVMPDDRPRPDLARALVDEVRRAGIRVVSATGWEDYDVRLLTSSLVYGDLQTSSHPVGFVQVRIRRRPRWLRLALAGGAAAAVAATVDPAFAAFVVAPAAVEAGRGWLRPRRLLSRLSRTSRMLGDSRPY